MAPQTRHYMNEPDIGSGEKAPAQEDVEREERRINPAASHPNDEQKAQKPDGKQPGEQLREQDHQQPLPAGRMLQSGEHLARIVATRLPDDTYEAQVYVRLTREPEIAETYIPAGTFSTEAEAWKAAEERARRAFKEHEF